MTVEYGRFDIALLCSPQMESGRHLGNEGELIGVTAKVVFLTVQSPIRDVAFGETNNLARTLSSVNDDGSLNCWGSAGIVVFRFDRHGVPHYCVNVAGEMALQTWAEAPVAGNLPVLLSDATHGNKLNDLDSYMGFLYRPEQGEETLGDFASEARAHFRNQKTKAKNLEVDLERIGKGFETRLNRLVDGSERRANARSRAFVEDVSGKAVNTLDNAGPVPAAAFTRMALDHLNGLRDQLNAQRESIMADVSKREALLTAAAAALKGATSKSRTGRLEGVDKPLNKHLDAAMILFKARHGLAVTTIALAALSLARNQLSELEQRIDGLRGSMLAAAQLCRDERLAFESAPVTPVTEMVNRPIYDGAELKELYRWACGSHWGSLPADAKTSIRQRIGGLSAWLNAEGNEIAASFTDACAPVFGSLREMTADGFIRWRRDVLGKGPALFLRDAAALASLLAKFDRTVTMEDEYDEGTLTILGVTSREESVFAGTPMTTLVSTGDPETLSYLVLKLGYAANTLWHYPEYVEANALIRKQGRIAHRVYPDFPPPDRRGGQPKGRRPGPRKGR